MKLNRQMCDQAKAYAERLAAMGKLKHSDKSERQGQGENLSMGCSTSGPQSMEEAVTNWWELSPNIDQQQNSPCDINTL